MKLEGLTLRFLLPVLLLGCVVRGQNTTQVPENPQGKALLDACAKDDQAQALGLLNEGAPVNAQDEHHNTPLILASIHDLTLLKALIAKGADLNAVDDENSTALLHACWFGHPECALALLEAGADPNIGSKWNRFPLMYAATRGMDDVVKSMIAHHAKLDTNCDEQGPAIYWALAQDHASTARLLVDAGADLNLKPTGSANPNSEERTPLGLAALAGELSLMDDMLTHGANVDTTSLDGRTALMDAAEYGQAAAVKKLLEANSNPDRQTTDGWSALMLAAFYGQDDAVQQLVQHHAQPDLKESHGRTALMLAAQEGYSSTCKVLADAGADVNAADNNGDSVVVYAGNRGNVELVNYLRSKGAKGDLHILPRYPPMRPLSPAQKWALAVGAIYMQHDGDNPLVLGGEVKGSMKESLKSDWNITDHASLIAELNDLRTGGHHMSYRTEGAKLAALSDADFQKFLQEHPEATAKATALRTAYAKWKDRIGEAWDWCRAVMLINFGFHEGFITEKEAWSLAIPFAQQVQANFTSWQEMSDNFLDGREIWAGTRDARFDACAALLLNMHDRNSVWARNVWATDLTATSDQ